MYVTLHVWKLYFYPLSTYTNPRNFSLKSYSECSIEILINLLEISGNSYIARVSDWDEILVWPVACDLQLVTCDLRLAKETCQLLSNQFELNFCCVTQRKAETLLGYTESTEDIAKEIKIEINKTTFLNSNHREDKKGGLHRAPVFTKPGADCIRLTKPRPDTKNINFRKNSHVISHDQVLA